VAVSAPLIKLIPGDTGRPITDIATDLEYPDLAKDGGLERRGSAHP
jgi:hypothetical protein